jgi:hypothetical protein
LVLLFLTHTPEAVPQLQQEAEQTLQGWPELAVRFAEPVGLGGPDLVGVLKASDCVRWRCPARRPAWIQKPCQPCWPAKMHGC